jgi:two-component system OmpR family response regulator
MKHRILVVAEDAPVRATLARWLMAAGYAVELAESPKRAREVVENEAVALAILAPRSGAAGQELARELRGAIGRLIIIVEPPADAGRETAEAIESDGSIAKPLDEAETLEKVKAALPAPPKEPEPLPDTLYFEGHILDVGARQCRNLDGRDRLLTRGEFTTLLALARQAGRVVSRDELRQAVVGRDAGPDDRSVDVTISRLRRKIELDPKEPRIIVTVPGEGYRLAEAAPSQDRHVPVVAQQPLPPSVATDPSMIETSAIDTRPPARRRRALWIGSAVLAGITTVLVAQWVWRLEGQEASLPVAGKFDASVVPLVTDMARHELETYPLQPDFKAVAIAAGAYGVASGAHDPSSAKAEALERCKLRSSSNRFCRLYAVGADVVWSIKSLPLPLPFDIHDEPLEEAFDAAALPLNMAGQIGYMNRADHRALALQGTPQGMGGFYAAFGTVLRPTAVRLAIEGCVDTYLSPCLLVSVDGLWTIRVPKSRRIAGVFMLTNEAAISGEDKQRIGAIYRQSDWRAMARGKTGGWYPVAGAPSESAAIEQALERCAEHDSGCHVYAISNFRVADEK